MVHGRFTLVWASGPRAMEVMTRLSPRRVDAESLDLLTREAVCSRSVWLPTLTCVDYSLKPGGHAGVLAPLTQTPQGSLVEKGGAAWSHGREGRTDGPMLRWRRGPGRRMAR